jgi:hypothetical protein
MYKLGKYYSRNPLKSFQSRKSDHIVRATKMYGVERILPNKELAQKTGCSVNALNQIVKKGEGAYYSSGSRPNQTARSWGLARLASSITGTILTAGGIGAIGNIYTGHSVGFANNNGGNTSKAYIQYNDTASSLDFIFN